MRVGGQDQHPTALGAREEWGDTWGSRNNPPPLCSAEQAPHNAGGGAQGRGGSRVGASLAAHHPPRQRIPLLHRQHPTSTDGCCAPCY